MQTKIQDKHNNGNVLQMKKKCAAECQNKHVNSKHVANPEMIMLVFGRRKKDYGQM